MIKFIKKSFLNTLNKREISMDNGNFFLIINIGSGGHKIYSSNYNFLLHPKSNNIEDYVFQL